MEWSTELGIIVGGVVLVALIVGAVVRHRRRQRARNQWTSPHHTHHPTYRIPLPRGCCGIDNFSSLSGPDRPLGEKELDDDEDGGGVMNNGAVTDEVPSHVTHESSYESHPTSASAQNVSGQSETMKISIPADEDHASATAPTSTQGAAASDSCPNGHPPPARDGSRLDPERFIPQNGSSMDSISLQQQTQAHQKPSGSPLKEVIKDLGPLHPLRSIQVMSPASLLHSLQQLGTRVLPSVVVGREDHAGHTRIIGESTLDLESPRGDKGDLSTPSHEFSQPPNLFANHQHPPALVPQEKSDVGPTTPLNGGPAAASPLGSPPPAPPPPQISEHHSVSSNQSSDAPDKTRISSPPIHPLAASTGALDGTASATSARTISPLPAPPAPFRRTRTASLVPIQRTSLSLGASPLEPQPPPSAPARHSISGVAISEGSFGGAEAGEATPDSAPFHTPTNLEPPNQPPHHQQQRAQTDGGSHWDFPAPALLDSSALSVASTAGLVALGATQNQAPTNFPLASGKDPLAQSTVCGDERMSSKSEEGQKGNNEGGTRNLDSAENLTSIGEDPPVHFSL